MLSDVFVFLFVVENAVIAALFLKKVLTSLENQEI